ncbi:pentatricopeptide repeat-containing protein At2g46050, mitochondrial [Beta vulgaris subsp. vulgaris]|uniref:pentatricopeptide repeat-containing protein At2g46050, mitochondrial n=1 Tax=Beta vulgaris subsp. vulgaris TaxID=3555 RepID=UPI0020370C18|nr:pentatricopeptide repeat-containing protein At2g46050, mitochondrial [Beta vulgaris subsp. vulgaris]
MISKWRIPSIYTVHFKNPLFLPVVRSSSYANGQNPPNRISRIGVLMNKSELTQYGNAHLTHSFSSLALKLSAIYGVLVEVKQLHSHVIKLGFYEALSMQNQVLYAYVKCGQFRVVDQVFDEMPVRNIVSWNTVISGAVSRVGLGFSYFKRMLLEMVYPDSTTMNALLRSNVVFNELAIGRQLHGFTMRVGLNLDCFVGSAIVDLYGKFGLVSDSQFAFDEMKLRDLVSWNVMVSVYSLNGLVKEAFMVFRSMQGKGIRGDEFTFTSLLNSCNLGGCCELFQQLQGLVIKLSFDLDLQVASALVNSHAKNGCVSDARKLFDGMVVRNIISWNTMIVGYGRHGYTEEAMELFVEMFRRKVKPDELTISSIISSCGNLAVISKTKQVHAYAIKCGFDAYISVANSLIVAYSNCGSLASASLCFNYVQEPDLVTWTSILSTYAFHGHVKQSIKIFEMMLSSGLKLDNIAFLGILSACSHGGLLSEGLQYFKLMITDHNIIPSTEHYACLIDLLGHAGLMEEASRILSSGPVVLESNALGALIGVSKACGHFKLAEWAAGKLFELEPENPVNYTLMSNMYASVGQWYDAEKVRNMMKQKCNSKLPGCSWIEIAGEVHTFLSSDTSHRLAHEAYSMLNMLSRVMKDDVLVDLRL